MSVRAWNLVRHIKGRTLAQVVRELGVEENIWT